MSADVQLGSLVSAPSFWRPDFLAPSAWLEHAPFAFWLVEALRPRMLVELGTHTGFSYLAFCQAVARLETATKAYAVDTWTGDQQAGYYGEDVFEQFAAYHDRRYSSFSCAIRSTFDQAVEHFEDGSIDLLHVDGLHTYESVRHDFDTWSPKLSSRAVVLLHDTNYRVGTFEVHRLWNELRQEHPGFEFVHGHGLGVLLVGPDIAHELSRLRETEDDKPLTAALRNVYARLGSAVRLEVELALARDAAGQAARVQDELQVRVADLEREAAERAQQVRELAARSALAAAALASAEEDRASSRDALAAAHEQVRVAQLDLALLRQTRTFRYSRGARAVYGLVRRRLRPRASAAEQAAPGREMEENISRERVRYELSRRYLHGSGIEIGPLHIPLDVDESVTVRYVDRMPVEELRAHYPELSDQRFVAPDMIDDGETLRSFADASVDFIIANHFIEHCENPIATIENHLRVLRSGGILYMAVPDKRRIFDSARPLTTVEHVSRDYEDGPRWSRLSHFEEYAQLVDQVEPYEQHARDLMQKRYSIHYHVWVPETFLQLVRHCQTVLKFPFVIEEMVSADIEFIVILRKTPSADLCQE